MLLREFLKTIAPGMTVIAYDLDAIPGNNRKEDEAGALAVAHHFDYQSQIRDLFIEPEHVTVWYHRS